jgi:hypothetical protein
MTSMEGGLIRRADIIMLMVFYNLMMKKMQTIWSLRMKNFQKMKMN